MSPAEDIPPREAPAPTARDLATEIVDAIVDAGIAGRDPVTRAELLIVVESAPILARVGSA